MGEGSGRGSGWIGSDFLSTIAGRVGSGRVNVSPGRVGSGPRKVTRGQLWSTIFLSMRRRDKAISIIHIGIQLAQKIT